MLFQTEKNSEEKIVIKSVCILEIITLMGKTAQVLWMLHQIRSMVFKHNIKDLTGTDFAINVFEFLEPYYFRKDKILLQKSLMTKLYDYYKPQNYSKTKSTL